MAPPLPVSYMDPDSLRHNDWVMLPGQLINILSTVPARFQK